MNQYIQKLRNNYEKIFIIIFMLLIMFPYLNSLTHIIKNEELKGVSEEKSKPTYGVKSYLKGEYQTDFDDYYLENFPYRNIAIKNYNQLRYTLFNKGTVIVGKEKYLYEESYIKEYLGIDIEVSDEYMNNLMNNLNVINSICKQNNKEMYIIITPSKAEIMSEYIPDKYYALASENEGYIRGYDLLTEKLNNMGIKYFDSPKYLKENESITPIFYKTGIHWSFVSSTQVLSNFIKYINNTSNLDIRNLDVIGTEMSTEPYFDEDEDMYSLLNIYSGKKDEFYYKPVVEYENKETSNNLFIQGGSFTWNLLEYMKKDIFKTIDFAFYQQFITKYDEDGNILQETIENNNISNEQFETLLQDKDIIILEVNQEFIPGWGNAFIENFRNYLEQYGFPTGK